MTLMWRLSLFSFIIGTFKAAEVCYDKLGCFNDHPPWGGTQQRPVGLVPWHPEDVGTRFLLFTQANRYYQEIKPDESIDVSNYGGRRKSRFVIPGYLKKNDENWPQDMCKAVVQRENVNCIAVEWKKGVKTRYAQAANNARVVAAQVAFMITFLMVTMGTDACVRLDTSDAAFVDVIHTDGLPFNSKLGLGMTEHVGHLEFFPNGGELMRGCSANSGRPTDLDSIWDGSKSFDGCNHVRAYQYYTESISKSQGFVGFPCSNKDDFADGKCFPCGQDECPLMGHHADKFTLIDGLSNTKYFLNTGRSKPFAREVWCRAALVLDGPEFITGIHFFSLKRGTLTSGKKYDVMIDAQVDVGEVMEVKFRWNNHIIDLLKPKYGASRVELQRGRDKEIFFFCGTEPVPENEIQTVLPCQA
uniref:Triacylglycerol lipase n=1 Tax=Nothobranchius furzeri TaxID=105023 RepID=A0A8C6LU77_NOTFU